MYGRLFSRIYNEFGWNYYPEAFAGQLLTWIERNSPGAKRVLDLGCGTGVLCRILRSRGFEADGADLSEDMIEIARREDPEGYYETADMTVFEPRCRYDIVTCTGDAINHLLQIGDVEKTFRRIYGYLEEDGCLIFDLLDESEISDSEPFDFQYDEKTEASFQMLRDDGGLVTLRILVKENGRPVHEETIKERLYDPDEICRLLKTIGFASVTCTHRLLADEGGSARTWYIIAYHRAGTVPVW